MEIVKVVWIIVSWTWVCPTCCHCCVLLYELCTRPFAGNNFITSHAKSNNPERNICTVPLPPEPNKVLEAGASDILVWDIFTGFAMVGLTGKQTPRSSVVISEQLGSVWRDRRDRKPVSLDFRWNVCRKEKIVGDCERKKNAK